MPAQFSILKRENDLLMLTAGADVAMPVGALFTASRSPRPRLLSKIGRAVSFCAAGSAAVACAAAALHFSPAFLTHLR